jgi:hypothetical protein
MIRPRVAPPGPLFFFFFFFSRRLSGVGGWAENNNTMSQRTAPRQRPCKRAQLINLVQNTGKYHAFRVRRSDERQQRQQERLQARRKDDYVARGRKGAATRQRNATARLAAAASSTARRGLLTRGMLQPWSASAPNTAAFFFDPDSEP